MRSSLHIWSERGTNSKDRPPGAGGGGAWPAPLLERSAAERDCDGRPRVSRAEPSRTYLRSEERLAVAQPTCLSEGSGRKREGRAASAESHRLRLREQTWKKSKQGRRRRNGSAGSQLPPAAGVKDGEEEESTGPRYERLLPTLTAVSA